MEFLTVSNLLMMAPSLELSKIIPTGCIYCYESLNLIDHKAMIIGTCQHLFCERCVNEYIFKDKEISDCPECFHQVHKSFAHPSRSFETISQTFQQLSKQPLKEEKIEEIERIVALKLRTSKEYECQRCGTFYDSQERKPVTLCKRQHTVCEECLHKSDKQAFKECKQCGEKIDPQQFYFNNLVMSVCDFITTALYKTN